MIWIEATWLLEAFNGPVTGRDLGNRWAGPPGGTGPATFERIGLVVRCPLAEHLVLGNPVAVRQRVQP